MGNVCACMNHGEHYQVNFQPPAGNGPSVPLDDLGLASTKNSPVSPRVSEPASPSTARSCKSDKVEALMGRSWGREIMESKEFGDSQYEGQQLDGLRHGFGRAVCSTGDIFEGQFDHGQVHGRGKFIAADGSVHEGQWDHDVRGGHWVERWSDGSCCQEGYIAVGNLLCQFDLALLLRASIEIIERMVGASSYGLVEILMRENSKMIVCMARASIAGQMGDCTEGCGMPTRCMVRATCDSKMAACTKANISRIASMGEGGLHLTMGERIKANG
eukprot:gnl/MRDRNA2_/MRDRNA2_70482_c0_seq1.p1 gnl/MRDRNA2_/MRDRNA2_70482_c0~~gnl/MRDRNA2_/MRDRNA2_70482_c0_seq1.p1  ORF type:complete len:273 (-),score=32.36 gnl/MRDRNA2_/MRDRNA2_70482_c0_seq1:36-854(-)